ncbi:beta-agarase [uncultured Maribacter sp.]|uniref:beta-agarase n=1 Tax=uncultured Maribacter sp. TaxID=431308 RepID=UPI00262057F0|nr:beta-agarase [uncultured Maribacter sp.]
MRFPIKIIVLLTLLFISCKQTDTKPQNKDLVLFDFEDQTDISNVKTVDANYWINDSKHLQISSGFFASKPSVKLKRPKGKHWDLNGYHQIKADVTNVGDAYMQAEMFVGNDPDELTRWYCSDYVDLNPGETKTITIDLAWTPWVFSPQLNIDGMRGTPGKIKTNIDAIDEIMFCSRYATTKNEFTVDNVRAVGTLEVRDTTGFFPFVDIFGQYKHKGWEGKTESVRDLKIKAEKNLKILSKKPGPKNRGKYGGWTAGPKLKATGFFRTEKHNNKWWMVDPEGYLFWTAGVNCVASTSSSTGITARENYFETLPSNDSEFAKFYGERGRASHGLYSKTERYKYYNFYQANMYKNYGSDWLNTFRDLTHRRFKSWGLNTIGFVSDKGATNQGKTPYVGSVWIRNTPKIEGSDGFWGKFHDVFDPRFKEAVTASMDVQREGAGDPFCIGYFVDNELSWGSLGSLAIGVLKSPETQMAKQEFVKDLRAKYGSINKLNNIWETSHGSWGDLLKSTKAPNKEKAWDDLVTFYGKIAETYFRIIKEELNVIAADHNYLGCRFAWANNDVVLTAASKYMDIMSFNKYEYSVENLKLPEGVDKPIMIGEFHFGALDRGNFHVGIKKAKNQSERGAMYKDYIEGALRNPLIVGAHWFQYIDEPLTGRFDGENYNVGLIDICDNPYEELVDKIRETTYPMYEYRTGHNLK